MNRPNLEQALSKFRFDYQGPKIAFLIAGGGFSILDFRRYPGGSRIYHTAIEPYNRDTANFLTKFAGAKIDDPESFSFVSAEGTSDALLGLINYCDDQNLLHVVINSACTTDHYRRGENRAYIATSRGDMFVFEMNKIDESSYEILSDKNHIYIDHIRLQEDRRIAQVAIGIIMADPSLYPNLEQGESVARMHNNRNGYLSNKNDIVHSH